MTMSQMLHFGRDFLGAPEEDLEELLNALDPSEVDQLLEDMAADPDDKHLPASVRTAYKCSKTPTGPLDRDSLINHINEEGLKAPETEEVVPYEPGKKRGKVFVPKLDAKQLAQKEKQDALEEETRLDEEEEEALAEASKEDLMALAEILGSNPQEFIKQAYSDPLKFYPPDPPNTTDPKEAISRVIRNDDNTTDINLNNIKGISEELFCELFDGLKYNEHLVRLSVANCDVNDFAMSRLISAMEENSTLRSINLESNRISPNCLGSLFESLVSRTNNVVEVHVANQAQDYMGFSAESRIADAIEKNDRLLKVGLRFEFAEVLDRVQVQLIKNIDCLRKERVQREGQSQYSDWVPARLIDDSQDNTEQNEDSDGDGCRSRT